MENNSLPQLQVQRQSEWQKINSQFDHEGIEGNQNQMWMEDNLQEFESHPLPNQRTEKEHRNIKPTLPKFDNLKHRKSANAILALPKISIEE